jgi:hypothetical protein
MPRIDDLAMVQNVSHKMLGDPSISAAVICRLPLSGVFTAQRRRLEKTVHYSAAVYQENN